MNASEHVRRLFDAYERDGVEAALEVVSEDAVLVVGPDSSAEPDTYEGREGARRYFAAFDGALDEVRFELIEIHDDSPSGLVGVVKLSGVGSATRIPVELDVLMSFAVRDGLVARIVSHADLESARAEISTPE